eukprot:3048136-Prymnesium_polylepis.1
MRNGHPVAALIWSMVTPSAISMSSRRVGRPSSSMHCGREGTPGKVNGAVQVPAVLRWARTPSSTLAGGDRGGFRTFFRTSLCLLRAPRCPGKPLRLAATFHGHSVLGAGLRFAAVGGSLCGWRVALRCE